MRSSTWSLQLSAVGFGASAERLPSLAPRLPRFGQGTQDDGPTRQFQSHQQDQARNENESDHMCPSQGPYQTVAQWWPPVVRPEIGGTDGVARQSTLVPWPGPFQSPALPAGRGREAFIPEGREPCRRRVADSGVVSSHRSPKFLTLERPCVPWRSSSGESRVAPARVRRSLHMPSSRSPEEPVAARCRRQESRGGSSRLVRG